MGRFAVGIVVALWVGGAGGAAAFTMGETSAALGTAQTLSGSAATNGAAVRNSVGAALGKASRGTAQQGWAEGDGTLGGGKTAKGAGWAASGGGKGGAKARNGGGWASAGGAKGTGWASAAGAGKGGAWAKGGDGARSAKR